MSGIVWRRAGKKRQLVAALASRGRESDPDGYKADFSHYSKLKGPFS